MASITVLSSLPSGVASAFTDGGTPGAAPVGLLSAILDACRGPINVKDAAGKVVFANGPMAALYGLRPETLVGRNIRDVHKNASEAEAYLAAEQRVLRSGVEETTETTFTPKGAEPRYFQAFRRRIVSESGEPLVLTIATDISAARSAEHEAAELHARWMLALAGLRDGVWDWDITGRTVTFSPRWKSMLGYEPHELLDSFVTFQRLLHPDDKGLMEERLEAHLVQREPYELEVRMRHKSGDWRWIHVRGQAAWDDEGRAVHMSGSHSDVTEERAAMVALRNANAFQKAILENLPVGVFVKSTAEETFGQFLVWNEQCTRLFERNEKEALGLTAFEITPDAALEMDRSDREVCALRRPISIPPVAARSPSGIERRLRTRKVPMFDGDGQLRWLLGITEDVSANLLAEEEREAALRRAEEASRIKSQFLANMSHEIRTPMNGVLGLIDLALDVALPAEARDLLETAQISAHNLLAIINEILDLSKIEAGEMVLDKLPFSLRDTVRDTAMLLASKADEKELALVIDIAPDVPDAVRGDVVRVRQILTNLLSNAVKFTVAGAVRIVVEREHAPTVADAERRIVIGVVDTGIGIPKEKLDTIFLPFRQADQSTTRRFGGTGLGLTICRELAIRMGGDVVATSEPGRGSRFDATLTLPALAPADPPPFRELTVLLTGLDGPSVALHARTLRGLGASVTEQPADGPAVAMPTRAAVAVVDGTRPAGAASPMIAALRGALGPLVPVVYLVPSLGAGLAAHDAECVTCTLRLPATSKDLRAAIERALAAVPGTGAPAVSHTRPGPIDSTELDGVRILLAEDNPINTRLATKMLEKMGCVVVHAANGREALDHFLGGTFELVLLDVQMPEMDGLECARAIRSAEVAGEHMPIIALTANAMKGDDELCLAAGMDSYVAKPFDRLKLREEIARLLRGRLAG